MTIFQDGLRPQITYFFENSNNKNNDDYLLKLLKFLFDDSFRTKKYKSSFLILCLDFFFLHNNESRILISCGRSPEWYPSINLSIITTNKYEKLTSKGS